MFGISHRLRRLLWRFTRATGFTDDGPRTLLGKFNRKTRGNGTQLTALLLALITVIFLIVKLIITLTGNHDLPRYHFSHQEFSHPLDSPFSVGCRDVEAEAAAAPRANAVLMMLARNSEAKGVAQSVRSLERHFNRWFNYPYVFLNDEEFDDNFMSTIRNLTNAKVEFGVVDQELWEFPPSADPEAVVEGIQHQGDRGLMYGGMRSYHLMCRFYSGSFYKHPLLQGYDWFWRIEPEVDYFCDITYDPFLEMEKNGKVYGFTVALKELASTVPNLFRYTKAFMKKQGIKPAKTWEMFLVPKDPMARYEDDMPKMLDELNKKKEEEKTEKRIGRILAKLERSGSRALTKNELSLLSMYNRLKEVDRYDIEGEEYNLCHFWSNFEIARLDFFRSEQYEAYFKYLDESGGFWKERWGDAPIHSLAVGMFLEPKQVHYFRDIGYRHSTIGHCPANADRSKQTKFMPYSRDKIDAKQNKFWAAFDSPTDYGSGCHCKCDPSISEIEDSDSGCFRNWKELLESI